MGNEVLITPFTLEAAIAVAVVQLVVHEEAEFAGGNLHCPDTLNHVFGLSAVGSYILHGSSPDVARNERQVLGPIESMADQFLNEYIPLNATAAEHTINVLVGNVDGRAHHNAIKVAGEQQVASSTYYYIRVSRFA